MNSLTFQYHKLNVPVALIQYSVDAGMRKPFALFLYFKMTNSGKMRLAKDKLQRAQEHLGIKDRRTITKYLQQLIQHNFIVYNPKSGIYFIRSFERLRQIYNFKKRTSVILTSDLLPSVQSFLDSALIGQLIQNQQFFWEIGRKQFRRPAIHKKDVAKTVIKVDEIERPAYYGASNYKIAKSLNCSTSTACKRKHKAEVAGLLKTKEHFQVICTIDMPDKCIRERIYHSIPDLIGKIRFKTVANSQTGKKEIQLLRQLHDEITPLISFSKRKKVIR